MQLTRLLLSIFILSTLPGFGQTDKCRKSTEGTDFWFGFMESRIYQAPNNHKTSITLTSIDDCTYTIEIGKVYFTSGSVPKNTPVQIDIPWDKVEAIGSEKIPFEKKAIHLVSTKPINVYALNWSNASSDVALIFPTESLGKEYYAMCYTPTYSLAGNGPNLNAKNSEFLIVASVDNTNISIIPSVMTDGKQTAGIPFLIKLSQGDLYQVQSANLPNLTGQGDLTGSYITSDQPIAVFSGSYSTSVPYGVCCYDHLYEQIPPVQTWGRKFIAVPLKTREIDYYRVLASEDNTIVRFGNTTLSPLRKGEYHEFTLSEPTLIDSDKPILFAQYSASNQVDRPPGVNQNDWDGDPFMVIVSPVNQTREKVAFVAYKSTLITNKYFINVVVKNDAADFINLSTGAVVTPIPFTPLSDTGYSYAQVQISQGSHIIESTEAGKGFIAYVYGFGGVESYGYGVGFNLDILLDLGGKINDNGEKILVRCDGAPPLTINAGNAFDTFEWSTGEKTSAISITEAGTYSVTASTPNGCSLSDEIKLEVSKPVVNFGPNRIICNPETTMLDAGATDPFDTYLWTTPPQTPQPVPTDQKITVSNPGIYAVEATNIHGCKASDEIKIDFVDKPILTFPNPETLICGTFNTTLDVVADKPVTYSLVSDPKVRIDGLTASVLPVDFGTYPVTLTAKDEFSCASDTTFNLGFYKTPAVDFTVNAKKCSGYNLDVSYLGDAIPAVSNFKWEFAGEVIANEIGLSSLVVPLGINRSQRDLSLTVTQDGCSGSYTYDVKVTPILTLQSEPKLGCEPFNVGFVADNSEVVNYYWDFGDGTSVEKSDKNTTHLYNKAGFYDVKLKITTIDPSGGEGCSNEVKIEKMVHVAPIPDVAFSLSPDDCLETGVNEISYSGLIGTVNDTYDWDVQQFDESEIVKHPLHTQGPFIFDLKTHPSATLGLKVTSEFGCISPPGSITLKRKPAFKIVSDYNAHCIPFEAHLSGIKNENDITDVIDFTWDFGDGSATAIGSTVTHTYNEAGKSYSLALTGKSSLTQCWSDVIMPDFLRTYPKPTALFSMDNTIVYNDKPTVNFSNQSTGATEYLWNFGDELTSGLKDPTHDYAITGYRTVLLEAINEFDCSDTITHRLLVAFDRIFPPNAFSPNAPNVIDREFKPGSIGVATEGYHLTILSRWNDIVFETRDEIKGWDGHMKNGTFAPAGVYVWNLNFNDFLGRKHRQTGTVTVVY